MSTQRKATVKDKKEWQKNSVNMSWVRSHVTHPRNGYPAWTEEDLLYLRTHYGTQSGKEIAKTLGRSVESIYVMASKQGYGARGTPSFSERSHVTALEREEKKKTIGAVFEQSRTPEQLEQARLYNKEYYQKNREKMLAKNQRFFHELHPTYMSERYLNNGEAERARIRQWGEKNRDHLRALKVRQEATRRARKVKSPLIELISFDSIYERDKGICWICLHSVPRDRVHFDHYIPLAKGGDHTMENLRVTHQTCNVRKQDNLPDSPQVLRLCKVLREEV